jgi:hypothetical protein
MKRRTRDRLRTIMAFAPLVALLVAIAYQMLGSHEHDEEQQGISQALGDYYKRK